MTTARRRRKTAWANELDDLIRAACGGFLFGIPLLYTMEVWWIGSFIEPLHMFLAIATTFIIVFLLNRTEGFRKTKDIRATDAFGDTIEAVAIGLSCSLFVLILLQEITLSTHLDEALGKVIFESLPFTLGVALANQYLKGADEGEGGRLGDAANGGNGQRQQSSRQPKQVGMNATLADIGATLIGSVVIALNIAPTDEVTMLTAAISGPWLLLIIATSLIISYGIVFEANFADQRKRRQQQGIFQRPLSETVAAYLISLLSAALMLFFFQQLSLDDPWTMWLTHTLVLGFPASIGGAAGRLLA